MPSPSVQACLLVLTIVLTSSSMAAALKPNFGGRQHLPKQGHKQFGFRGGGNTRESRGLSGIFGSLKKQREGRLANSANAAGARTHTQTHSADRERGFTPRTAASADDDAQRQEYQFDFAPAMTIAKYEAMTERRVLVTIQYAGFGGYAVYCDAAEQIIKEQCPDVLIKREVLPVLGPRSEGAFDLLVDGEVVYSKRRDRSSVYLQMSVIKEAIRKQRKERRHGKAVYGEPSTFDLPNGAGSGSHTGEI